MNKKIFDIKLFRDAFRQLKVMGGIFLGMFLASSLFPLLMRGITTRQQYSAMPELLKPDHIFPATILPLGLLCFMLAAPFLCLKAFQFTTKRSSSDFYYALPQTRLCLFTSHFGAALLWLLIVLFLPALLGGLTAALFPDCFIFSFGALLEYALKILAVSLYVMAFTAMAVSLSGTLFGNVLTALFLLFGLRIVVFVLCQAVVDNHFILIDGTLPWPLSQINLFTRFSYNAMNNDGLTLDKSAIGSGSSEWLAILYTLGAAILWTGLAAFLFRRRKSEMAENTVYSPRIRTLLRLGFSMIICLIPLSYLYRQRGNFGYTDQVTIIFGFLVALLVFFGTELILTRSFRSLKKTLPSLGILVALNLLAFGGMLLGDRIARDYRPEPEELSYVRLAGSESNYYWDAENYFSNRTKSIRLEDTEIKALLAQALKRSAEEGRKNSGHFAYYDGRAQQLTVAFKSGLQERFRRVNLTEEEMGSLIKALEKNKAYQEAYVNLPEEDRLTVDYYGLMEVSADESMEIYRCLKEEVRELGFETWYKTLRRIHGVDDPNAESDIGSLSVLVQEKGTGTSRLFLPINKNLPKTYAKSLEICEKAAHRTQADIVEMLDQLLSKDEKEVGALFHLVAYDETAFLNFQNRCLYGDINKSGIKYYGSEESFISLSKEQLQRLRDIMARADMQEIVWDGSANLQIFPESIGVTGENVTIQSVAPIFLLRQLPQDLIDLLKELK